MAPDGWLTERPVIRPPSGREHGIAAFIVTTVVMTMIIIIGITGIVAIDFAPAQLQQQRGGRLGARGSGQDRAIILFEELQPVVDIAGVVVEMGDRQPEFGTKHRAREFGHQFLGGIALRTEPVPEVTRKPAGMAGPVRLMPISA